MAIGGEFLTFRLGAEEYGIDILKVQEIRRYERRRASPTRPAFIKGVVNLRGVIVPIVDLRLKLGCERAEYNSFTVVIVLNVTGRVVGAVVDSVSDVLQLAADIRPAPALGGAAGALPVIGIGSLLAEGGSPRTLVLLDMVRLLAGSGLAAVAVRAASEAGVAGADAALANTPAMVPAVAALA